MSANVCVYIDPSGCEDPLNLEGPDTYFFEGSLTTKLVEGRNEPGKRVYEDLTPEEQETLRTTGWSGEEEIELQDPDALHETLMKLYDICARLFENEELEAEQFSPLDILRRMQRDVGGALLICERAVAQGKDVYWALW